MYCTIRQPSFNNNIANKNIHQLYNVHNIYIYMRTMTNTTTMNFCPALYYAYKVLTRMGEGSFLLRFPSAGKSIVLLSCYFNFCFVFFLFIHRNRVGCVCRLPNEFNQSKGNRWTVVSFLYIVTRINGFLDSHFSTLATPAEFVTVWGRSRSKTAAVPFPAIGTRGNSYGHKVSINCIICTRLG